MSTAGPDVRSGDDNSTIPAKPRSPLRPLRRHRGLTAMAAVVVAALVLVIWGQLAPKGDRDPLSLNNPGPEGARALGQILGRHGVDVLAANNYEAAMAALGKGDSPTLLLYDRNGILEQDKLRGLLATADRVIVLTPRLQTLADLDIGIRQAGVVPEGGAPALEPGCSVSIADTTGQVTGEGGFVYDGGTSCYRPAGSSAGLLAASANGQVVVLGSTAVLSNRHLDKLGNAALSIRALGVSPTLVWYLPSVQDLEASGSSQTLNDLAPGWAKFLGPWLVLVALAGIAWRGRRFGPLVFEPLPVVVKAVETVEGRARLYHDFHAVEQARDNLRAGTLVRIAGTLRLGPGATAAETVDAAARHLARPARDINELINEYPGTEARLVAWSQELDALEKEVNSR